MKSFDFRSWLDGLSSRGVKLGLDRMTQLLYRLGDPQKSFDAIHIAGTNGKGSTAAFCAGLLLAAARASLRGGVVPGKIGLYTSPHLLRLTERIQYSDPGFDQLQECEKQDLARIVLLIHDIAPDVTLTFFEVMTAAAFLLFAEKGVQIAIIEVGLGGRLDATRLCHPISSIITGISKDHTEILGDTLPQIAYEKSGIFQPGIPAYAACEDEDAKKMLIQRASAVGCSLSFLDPSRSDSIPPVPSHLSTHVALLGQHQLCNAALALAAVKHVPMPFQSWVNKDQVIEEGLSKTRWPGRLECLMVLQNQSEIWVDAAHNQQGADVLAQWIKHRTNHQKLTVVFGASKDKAIADMLAPMWFAQTIVLTRPRSHRAEDPEKILPLVKQACPCAHIVVVPQIEQALSFAIQSTQSQGYILVYGSLFLIGPVRQILLDEPADPEMLQDPYRIS